MQSIFYTANLYFVSLKYTAMRITIQSTYEEAKFLL